MRLKILQGLARITDAQPTHQRQRHRRSKKDGKYQQQTATDAVRQEAGRSQYSRFHANLLQRKKIPGTALGTDELRAGGIFFDLAPQTQDQDIDGAVEGFGMLSA